MVAFLGGLVVALLFVVAGLWATVRKERTGRARSESRMDAMESYVTQLEANHQRVSEDVPPRAVQFVVVRVGEHAEEPSDERITDVCALPTFDLQSMGDSRPTLA